MVEDPSQRIFHIDKECYIIYLGSGREDYRPFLRIGSSSHLPERVKSFISTVIVTDSLTGNQCIEHENLQLPLNGETRYVGDPDRVNRIKQFLDEKDLPVEGYVYETVEEPSKKGGAFVFFFKSGNLHVHYNGKEIFDLHNREREDGHFVSRAERIVNFVKSNPFRYLTKDFGAPGFFLAGGRCYFSHEGKLGTIGLPDDYIVDLGRFGVDPDLTLWLVEDKLSEGLLNRLKRAAITHRELRIASSAIERMKSSLNLFTDRGISCILINFLPDDEKVISGFSLKRSNPFVDIAFPGSQKPVIRCAAERGPSAHDVQDMVKSLVRFGAPANLALVQGVPYRFPSAAALDLSRIAEDYIENIAGELLTLEEPASAGILESISQFSSSLLSPRDTGLQKAKPFSLPENPSLLFLVWNIREFARLADTQPGISSAVKKSAAKLSSLFGKAEMPDSNSTRLPFLGDFLQLNAKVYLFYRFAGVLTPLKLLQAEKSIENIEKLRAQAENGGFAKERQRLEQFLAGLTEVVPKRKKVPVSPPEERRAADESPRQNTAENTGPSAEERSEHPGGSENAKNPRSDSASPPAKDGKGKKSSSAVASSAGRETASGLSGSSGAFPGAGPDQGGPGKKKTVKTFLLVILAAGFLAAVIAGFMYIRPGAGGSAGTSAAADKGPSAEPPGGTSDTVADQIAAPEAAPGTAAGESAENLPGRDAARDAGSEPSPDRPAHTAGQAGPVPEDKALRHAGEAAGTAGSPADLKAPGDAEQAVKTPAAPTVSYSGIDPDRIRITILDVFYLVNIIAVNNGYRPLDRPEDIRPDPNWIFPGSSFMTPDKVSYTVKAGDTLWDITMSYIRSRLRERVRELESSLGPYRQDPKSSQKKEVAVQTIKKIRSEALCEEFGVLLEKLERTISEE